MKNVKNIIAIVCISLLAVSCKKFGDTNINPNGVSIPATGALLTSAERQIGGLHGSSTNGGLYGGIYTQVLTETQYTEVSLYASPKVDFDNIYAGPLYDLQKIIDVNSGYEGAEAATNALNYGASVNQIAVARILKAYIFWTITDRWGDVPYSEALKGTKNTQHDAILTPKYDKQQDIYADLEKELKEAKDQIDPSLPAPSGDIIYYKANYPNAVDITTWTSTASGQWKKLANSLRMLIALRTSKVDASASGFGGTNFSEAFNDADGYIASNTDNFVERYPGNVDLYSSPWWNLYNGRSDYGVTSQFFAILGADPRASVFASSTTGFPYGLPRDQAVAFGSANAGYARVLKGSSTPRTAPEVIVSAANVLLAISEAIQLGWVAGDAATFYQNGIQASWDQWGVTGDLAGYIASHPFTLTNTRLQEFIAWYPDGLQAWAEWRRTGVPTLTPTAYATNSGCLNQIPRRFIYGSNEDRTNLANMQAAVAESLGGQNTECARVWWDKP
jgi:hypothetical protein